MSDASVKQDAKDAKAAAKDAKANKPTVALLGPGDKLVEPKKGDPPAFQVQENGDDTFDVYGSPGAVFTFVSENYKVAFPEGVNGRHVYVKIHHVDRVAITEGETNILGYATWPDGSQPPCTLTIPVELVDAVGGGTIGTKVKLGKPTIA